ncbi:hypothetical protein J1N35_010742 [Gossypium stocksii]|uniref:Uncharacterized protein n=1 Tax=Gossypium stocksii TaxID=47602 RepID=A0A9D3W104_9ROSI|nr:hypothetical protein J1N35_010742 [Gossypium stocksii]
MLLEHNLAPARVAVAPIPCCTLLPRTPEWHTLLIMPRKRTHASAQIEKSQSKFHCEKAKVKYETCIRQVVEALNWELFCEKRPSVDEELVREFYANSTSSKLTEVPVHGIKVPITANAINDFFEFPYFKNDEYSSLMSNIEPENLQEILEELTVPGKTIDVGKIILREIQNCAVRHSGPAYFPFTITILCLKAKILANIKKTRYSHGTITDWDLFGVAGDSVL